MAAVGRPFSIDDRPGTPRRVVESINSYELKDRGQVALALRFTDQSNGVFLSDVLVIPEPSSLLLLCVGAVACGGVARGNALRRGFKPTAIREERPARGDTGVSLMPSEFE